VISIDGSDALASLIHHLTVAFGAKPTLFGTDAECIGRD
jgi:hypothetical protein